jgi:arylsulfatase A-like enzyme
MRSGLSLSVTVPAALAVLSAALLALASCGAESDRPNVLLITVDTLRPDHLGGHGHPRGPSPVIDALFAQGTAFSGHTVPRGQTWPTLASIQTSRYPVSHGVRKNGQTLPEGVLGLAEILRREGYECGAFLGNSGGVGWKGFTPVLEQRDRDRALVSRARGWIRGNLAGPYFLWIHLFSPHRPFQPPPPFDELYDPDYAGPIDGSIEQMKRIAAERTDLPPSDLEHMLARYDGEIRYLDGILADLLRVTEETDTEDRTLVVFTADHGEELYARNHYFSHSASVYDTVLRAPLLLVWPGKIDAGRWIPGIVESIDIAPTILDLLGIARPDAFEGRSLSPQIAGGLPPDRSRMAFSELEDKVVSLRTEDWRYIHNPSGFGFPLSPDGAVYPIGREELYDHRDDPRERRDVAGDREEVVARLREVVARWQSEHRWEERSRLHAEREVPEHIREALEAIGYVQ